MLALPGSAYLYNGEELGLDEVLDLPDELREDPAFLRTGESRDGCRVPIPWGTGDLAWVRPVAAAARALGAAHRRRRRRTTRTRR